jgi:hypothetical protein
MRFIIQLLMRACLAVLAPALCFAQGGIDTLNAKILQPRAMQADFTYLRKALEETHPGLYRYVPKADMTRKMDSLYARLDQPLPYWSYYALLSSLVGEIRCAHTFMVPTENTNGFLNQARIFPFTIRFVNADQACVVLNRSKDTTLRPGFELLSINGESIQSLKERLWLHAWADGHIESARRYRMSNDMFLFLYYTLIGRPEKFVVEALDAGGKPIRAEVPALVYTDTQQLLMNNPVNQQLLKAALPMEKKMRRQPWQLEILKDMPAAKLTISGFGGKSGPAFQKRFSRFLEESFRELKKKNVPNLVIDLLNNGGGYDAGGVALFSYLISKPTRYYGRQHTVTDGSSTYLRFADVSAEDIADEKKGMVREEDGTYTLKRDFDQGVSPNPDHYTGKVYFLVNGLSGSTTAEFTAAAHYNKLGTFIGEETGGAYCGGNGSSFIHLTLPHSKIYVNIPLVYYQMAVEGDCAAGRGTMPDYPVTLKPSFFYDFINPLSEVVKDLINGQAVKRDQDVRN